MQPTTRRSVPRVLIVALLALSALALLACDDDGEGDAAPTTTAGAATPETTGTAGPAGGASPTATPSDAASGVSMGACPFQLPPGTQIECGTLEVPLHHDDPAAGTVTLSFAVARSQAQAPAEDPVVFLAGGPGQSALEFIPVAFGELYEPLLGNRDLIILDQRGTGLSEPSLACTEYTEWAQQSVTSDLPPEELEAEARAVLVDCRERLAAEGVDFSAYHSVASAHDLEALRQALGHAEWNLYGQSYGVRLALTAMRETPDGIRSVVLDSAYPLEVNLYEAAPGNAARAMDALFAACAQDAGCAERFPQLEQTFATLVEDLNASPAPIMFLNPLTGQPVEGELTGDGLAGFLFQNLYSTELIPFLPELIDQASQGEFSTIGLLQGAYLAQLDLVSLGMQLAVQCQEEVPFSTAEAVAAAAEQHPLVQGFFQTAPTLGPTLFELCAAGWGAGETPPEGNEAVTSDIPTLVLAGELDPITPPMWGESVAANLPNSSFFTFPSTGHGVVPSHECAAGMTHAFLDAPSEAPDAACIEEIGPPAFTAGAVDVTMSPYTSEVLGFEGVSPEGWTEVAPGVHQGSPLAALIQQVVPGTTADQLLQQVATQLGASAPPEPVGQIETDFATWDHYVIENLGQAVHLALAEHEGALLIVQVTTTPERSDAYREKVFAPAVQAFNPAP